ncbi:RagB/SusD family nutrient uptake outer membrane protein [Sphingobacterium sp. UDSM-2020]|uniref:RagB/SusD family nutrient uptake outer membrane protein n=1 Tax=Sphingobacterium sp. UDSM-2020 TaxID=2795738 RepID=UPI001935919D|nr:RagB/SusD family nutrient uptake outer membrane protein [Sphingobacterium sp. UDSM-2020]QQD15603.1 RagB/SusD family nutrient uptake outer membrane protein [Sphingobacterium sp. UDSM-2020]
MKFKHILSVIGISSALMLGSSCGKYLNLSPQGSTYDEVFWTDGPNVEKATLGAYALLRDAVRNERSYFIFGDIGSGMLKSTEWNYADFARAGEFRFGRAPYLENSLWDWTRFYKIINQCNLIVEHTTAMDVSLFENGEDDKNQYIANAKFLRAYTYFYMQRVWGDVLLVKETFKDPQNIPDMARSPQAETLKFCKEDLVFAAANLGQGPAKSFASKGAANALLAEVYAWEHDYVNAEKYIAETLKGGYALEDIKDYKKIWQGNSKESIFELNMLYNDTGREWSTDFFNVFLTGADVPGKGSGSVWEIDPTLLEKKTSAEDRIDGLRDGSARFDLITTAFPDNSERLTLRKYDRVNFYSATDLGAYAVDNNLVLIRLADIILLRAEAYFKNGKQNLALEDLNTIRNRAGLPNITLAGDELFKEIFLERRRELIGEGTIQFDLIRMELLEEMNNYNTDRIALQGYYWPLNMRALLPQNESLTQNPYWRNH